MNHFKDIKKLEIILNKLGFQRFGPGHSARNGYDIHVTPTRRACFYDNSIFGEESDKRIEFTVMDYGKNNVYSEKIFGFYTKKEITRYSIFTLFLGKNDINESTVKTLLQVAKSLE